MPKSHFGLRTLIALAVLALAAGFYRFTGGVGASVVIISLMILYATRISRFGDLIATEDGVIWCGGILSWLATFCTFTYGPMGAEVSLYSLMRNIDISLTGLGWLVTVSPALFAVLTAILAFVSIASGGNAQIVKVRSASICLFIFAITALKIIVSIAFSQPLATIATAGAVSTVFLVAASATFMLCRSPTKRMFALHLVASLMLLVELVPLHYTDGLFSVLRSYGAGYWLLCLGIGMVGGAATVAVSRNA